MVNENQPNLEDKLFNLGSLASVSKNINDSKNPSEKGSLYEMAAQIIAGPSSFKRDGNQVRNEDYFNFIKEIRYSPEIAQMNIQGNIGARVNEIEAEYKSNKDSILKKITSSINKGLSKAKNKIEATQILVPYLSDIIGIKEPTQHEADEYQNQDFSQRLRIPYAFDQSGSIDGYKDLRLRTLMSEFIKENKEGNKVTYEVDNSKIKELAEETLSGAVLYTKAKSIERSQQQRE